MPLDSFVKIVVEEQVLLLQLFKLLLSFEAIGVEAINLNVPRSAILSFGWDLSIILPQLDVSVGVVGLYQTFWTTLVLIDTEANVRNVCRHCIRRVFTGPIRLFSIIILEAPWIDLSEAATHLEALSLLLIVMPQ